MRNVSMAEARQHLGDYVQAAEESRERTIIVKNGRPVAVIMSVDELESLEETNAILSDLNSCVRSERQRPSWPAASASLLSKCGQSSNGGVGNADRPQPGASRGASHCS
jgi:prevent-host-death family protein